MAVVPSMHDFCSKDLIRHILYPCWNRWRAVVFAIVVRSANHDRVAPARIVDLSDAFEKPMGGGISI